jgi:cell division septation protein DedD
MPSQDSHTVAEPTAASEIIAPVPGETPEKVAAEAPPPEAAQPAEETEVTPIEPPARPTVAATVKPKVQPAPPKKTASVESEKIESPEPLVLVPPQDTQAVGQTTALPAPVTQSPDKQSGSFFNFNNTGKKRLTGKRAEQPDFSNSNMINSGPKSVSADATDPNQVAAISPTDQTQPLPMPAPQKSEPTSQSTASGGYVAQLASFRSEAEAMAEYDRLRSKYSDVVGGLAPRVTKASVSGATRYRLGVGPVASREAASRICNSLIAAGERDCLVRGN